MKQKIQMVQFARTGGAYRVKRTGVLTGRWAPCNVDCICPQVEVRWNPNTNPSRLDWTLKELWCVAGMTFVDGQLSILV
jgi:hypothetical protein